MTEDPVRQGSWEGLQDVRTEEREREGEREREREVKGKLRENRKGKKGQNESDGNLNSTNLGGNASYSSWYGGKGTVTMAWERKGRGGRGATRGKD